MVMNPNPFVSRDQAISPIYCGSVEVKTFYMNLKVQILLGSEDRSGESLSKRENSTKKSRPI